jgi:hypothetical protein
MTSGDGKPPTGVALSAFHSTLLRESFPTGLGDEDAVLVFTLLHCYAIELTGPVLSDCPQVELLPPITQRHCGEVLASLWESTLDPRNDYFFWYSRWNEWGSYSRVEAISAVERDSLMQLKQQLERHPLVKRLVPGD